jgi:hypothetical protein
MSWTREDLDEYQKMLDEESDFDRLLREAREGESAAEWYFDRDCEIKAANWYHGAMQRYAILAMYAIGMLLSDQTLEEIDDLWEEATKEFYPEYPEETDETRLPQADE